MSEQRASEETIEREQVAPGLVMEAIHTHEPDGRYLIYYNFRTTGEVESIERDSKRSADPGSRL
jgi:hypothetical protein